MLCGGNRRVSHPSHTLFTAHYNEKPSKLKLLYKPSMCFQNMQMFICTLMLCRCYCGTLKTNSRRNEEVPTDMNIICMKNISHLQITYRSFTEKTFDFSSTTMMLSFFLSLAFSSSSSCSYTGR